MARPLKMGLDYFPFDVDFFQDEGIQLLRGIVGGVYPVNGIEKQPRQPGVAPGVIGTYGHRYHPGTEGNAIKDAFLKSNHFFHDYTKNTEFYNAFLPTAAGSGSRTGFVFAPEPTQGQVFVPGGQEEAAVLLLCGEIHGHGAAVQGAYAPFSSPESFFPG